MKIEINTETMELVQTGIYGRTLINTDDYTELKGKTVDEIKQMDLKTLLELETNDGESLVETMEYQLDVEDIYTRDEFEYDGGENIEEITGWTVKHR
jgi:hypothetical protein